MGQGFEDEVEEWVPFHYSVFVCGRVLTQQQNTAFTAKDLQNPGDPVNKIPSTPIVASGFSKDSNLFA